MKIDLGIENITISCTSVKWLFYITCTGLTLSDLKFHILGVFMQPLHVGGGGGVITLNTEN